MDKTEKTKELRKLLETYDEMIKFKNNFLLNKSDNLMITKQLIDDYEKELKDKFKSHYIHNLTNINENKIMLKIEDLIDELLKLKQEEITPRRSFCYTFGKYTFQIGTY